MASWHLFVVVLQICLVLSPWTGGAPDKDFEGLVGFDGHSHTTNSDGTLTTQKTIDEASKSDVKLLWITDHNKIMSTSEFNELQEYATKNNVDLGIGMEMTCQQFSETHIVSYIPNSYYKDGNRNIFKELKGTFGKDGDLSIEDMATRVMQTKSRRNLELVSYIPLMLKYWIYQRLKNEGIPEDEKDAMLTMKKLVGSYWIQAEPDNLETYEPWTENTANWWPLPDQAQKTLSRVNELFGKAPDATLELIAKWNSKTKDELQMPHVQLWLAKMFGLQMTNLMPPRNSKKANQLHILSWDLYTGRIMLSTDEQATARTKGYIVTTDSWTPKCEDATNLLLKAGIFISIAHIPMSWEAKLQGAAKMVGAVNSPNIKQLIVGAVKSLKIKAVEITSGEFCPQDVQLMMEVVEQGPFLATMGSDAHGEQKPHVALGVLRPTDETFEKRCGTRTKNFYQDTDLAKFVLLQRQARSLLSELRLCPFSLCGQAPQQPVPPNCGCVDQPKLSHVQRLKAVFGGKANLKAALRPPMPDN